MVGDNEFILNHSTVIEAMQEYLDKRMRKFSPCVVKVEEARDSRAAGGAPTFRIYATQKSRSS